MLILLDLPGSTFEEIYRSVAFLIARLAPILTPVGFEQLDFCKILSKLHIFNPQVELMLNSWIYPAVVLNKT